MHLSRCYAAVCLSAVALASSLPDHLIWPRIGSDHNATLISNSTLTNMTISKNITSNIGFHSHEGTRIVSLAQATQQNGLSETNTHHASLSTLSGTHVKSHLPVALSGSTPSGGPAVHSENASTISHSLASVASAHREPPLNTGTLNITALSSNSTATGVGRASINATSAATSVLSSTTGFVKSSLYDSNSTSHGFSVLTTPYASQNFSFQAATVSLASQARGNLSTMQSKPSSKHNFTLTSPRNETQVCSSQDNDSAQWTDTEGWNTFGLWTNIAGINVTAKYNVTPDSNFIAGPKRPLVSLAKCNSSEAGTNTTAGGNTISSNNTSTSSPSPHFSSPRIKNFNNGVQLRILPLGASIVYGLKSPDGNGFRYGLRNQLVYSGNPVNMIGSVSTGTMADGQCECWPGFTITQVADKAELSIPSQPNLILLHVGTNDCVQNIDIHNAGSRLGALIDHLFATIPGVTIIASTLLPNQNSNTQANINIYNSQIPGVIQSRQASGQKITYVDFSSSYFSTADLGSDGTHPTESGYMKMAEVWFQGITVANDQGWITAPAQVSGLSDTVTSGSNTCDKTPGAAIGPVQTQMGSGSDDGAYFHISEQIAGFAGFDNPSSVNFNNPLPEGVFWADINGDGIDDYVYVGSKSEYGLGVALSQGQGLFGPYLYSTFSPSCNRKGVWFVDITGDGRDDFCCLGPDGGLVCWENTPSEESRNPNWVAMGTVKESEGYPQSQVRLADIDGDGRADYVVFDATTTYIYGWRNGAQQPGPPEYWYQMNGVFSGLPPHALSGWRFVDLNGDKKDDLVWVSENGSVTTWINRRGFSVGLGPAWVSHGITHKGSDHPVNVTFGASLGSGRADYALGSIKNGNVYVDRWRNEDHGGTMVRGDGTFYCDMTGSGSDDYIFINATGAITLFENDHNWGYWIPWGVIYNAHRARQDIHLADFDGDGKCDILVADRETGTTYVIQNNYGSSGFSFTDLGVVTGNAECTEGYGTDKHDKGVRWNDIDGDGRADFLCMQTNGVIHGYLNKGIGNMVDQGLIKHNEGKERVNLRLADINGDGRDDFLYVNMLNGSVTAWMNGGQIESSGSAFQWNWKGVVSPGGSSRGACVEFGALYGLGRADYIVVEPATNKAWTWFNVCPDGIGAVKPSLPSGAPSVPSPVAPTTTVSPATTTSQSNGQSPTTTRPFESTSPIPTDGSGYVTIDPSLWDGPEESQTVSCYPPCTYVMPPSTLATPTTFSFPPIVTQLTIGGYQTITQTITGYITTLSYYAISMLTTTINIPAVTTSVISWFDVTATNNSTVLYLIPSITQTSYVITEPSTFYSSSRGPSTRTFYPPPWPGSTLPPSLSLPGTTVSDQPRTTTTAQGGRTVHHTRGSPGPSCARALGCGSHCNPILNACHPCWLGCSGPPGLDGLDPEGPGNQPPGNPNGDPDNSSECESSTYSNCETICAQATPTSCEVSCTTMVECDGESTETSSCILLPTGTNTFIWTSDDEDPPVLGAGGILGSIYLGAMSTSASFSPSLVKGDTTVDPVTDATTTATPVTTTTTHSTRTTTVYVLSTKTITSVSQYSSYVGEFRISANLRNEVQVAAAFAQTTTMTTVQSSATLAPRAVIPVTDYNLNYYPSGDYTINHCSAKNFDVYGAGTPTPKTWSDYPATVAFVSTISLDDTGTKLSSCTYTNTAAPENGLGGAMFCGSSTFDCSAGLLETYRCNYDDAAGYLTTMVVLAFCDVQTTMTSLITTTSVVTVATQISTIVT